MPEDSHNWPLHPHYIKNAMVIGEWILILALHARIRRTKRDLCVRAASDQQVRLTKPLFALQIGLSRPILLVLALLAGFTSVAGSQALRNEDGPSDALATVSSVQSYPAYSRPTENEKFKNYVFDAVGPYPFLAAGFAAGINQLNNTPPEWNQGAKGYGRRFGSDFGIAFTSTTTRYALSEAFKEDTLYYRCECRGVFPRLRYAALTTLIARRDRDGHRVFSVPALVAPYAGSMTAVYGWYPDRYGAEDAFRMGNYSLLFYAGGNIAMEFLYGGPHTLLPRMHLGKIHGAQEGGPKN
jgi:hypothetical protein